MNAEKSVYLGVYVCAKGNVMETKKETSPCLDGIHMVDIWHSEIIPFPAKSKPGRLSHNAPAILGPHYHHAATIEV